MLYYNCSKGQGNAVQVLNCGQRALKGGHHVKTPCPKDKKLFQRNLKKPLDNQDIMCYNKHVR